MITPEKLKELRKSNAEHSFTFWEDAQECFDTLEALWRVAKAAEEVLKDECDYIMFNAACHCHGSAKKIREALAGLHEEREK